jgi:hypothetical protein
MPTEPPIVKAHEMSSVIVETHRPRSGGVEIGPTCRI